MQETIEQSGGLMTVKDFTAWARVGVTKTYELMAGGDIEAVKMGSRTMIRRASAERWAASLPPADLSPKKARSAKADQSAASERAA